MPDRTWAFMRGKRKVESGEESHTTGTKAKACQFTLLPGDIERIERQRSRYQRLALAKSDAPVDIAKSEIVRAGISALMSLSDQQFFKHVESRAVLNKGRPAKIKKPTREKA